MDNSVRTAFWDIDAVQSFMIVFGLISTVFDLLTFILLLELFKATEATFQTTWFVVSLLTELAVILVLRTHLPSWRSRPSRIVVAATVVVGIVGIAMPYLPPIAAPFGFVPLSPALLLTGLGIVAAYIAITELAKRLYWHEKRGLALGWLRSRRIG